MELNIENSICETIMKTSGDCFLMDDRPKCTLCPFWDKCAQKMLSEGVYISKHKRVEWAMDKLAEEYLLNDNNE